MDFAAKVFILLLNVIILNAAFLLIHISNFRKAVKILLLIAGNAVVVGGTIYIIYAFGL